MKVRHTLADGMFGAKTRREHKVRVEEFENADSMRRAVCVSVETVGFEKEI